MRDCQRQRWRRSVCAIHGTSSQVFSTIILLLLNCRAQLILNDVAEDNSGVVIASKEGDGESVNSSNETTGQQRPRITLLGLEDLLNLERSGIVGLGNDFDKEKNIDMPPRLNYNQLHADDMFEDSIYDPFSADFSCIEENNEDDGGSSSANCWHPPDSTVEEEIVHSVPDCEDGASMSAGLETLAWGYGGIDPDDGMLEGQREVEKDNSSEGIDEIKATEDEKLQCKAPTDILALKENKVIDSHQCEATRKKFVDKHWGSDVNILKMRDKLRGRRGKYWDMESSNTDQASNQENRKFADNQTQGTANKDTRPPVFLMPGLASTRLVAWKHKPCPQNPLLSDIKMLDYVWLNMNLLLQMATIDARCWNECMTLGKYQSDYDGADDDIIGDDINARGCKLRPDEGLDSISSLAPGSISSNFLVGGTNTVYAWLIQWLADNLGYDVTSIVALPYDWRLSPDKMESRDGFLTLTRRKIEAAVESNGQPGIMVAHSMGNNVFRYFLEWLRVQMREEAYKRFVEHAKVTASAQSTARAVGWGPIFWRRRTFRRLANNAENDTGMILERDAKEIPYDSSLYDLSRFLEDEEHHLQRNSDIKETESGLGDSTGRKFPQLYELAQVEGDLNWIAWLDKHIWTYVGLAAPLLGAPGPLRSVLSGENMGLPFTHEEARGLELSFGSTSTVNPISTKMGFCDGDDDGEFRKGWSRGANKNKKNSNLACLEELVTGIESSNSTTNPWEEFPALRLLLKDRVDFDSAFPTIRVERDYCIENEKSPCNNYSAIDFGPSDIMSGNLFDQFSSIWREKGDPLGVKLDQLRRSWWHGSVPNMLETTPERPHIKHVIMAYGVDVATEVGYIYKKTDRAHANADDWSATKKEKSDGVPSLARIIWEEPRGRLVSESHISEPTSFTDTLLFKKKEKRRPLRIASDKATMWLHHSGDGTIPYISLMWAHTWLLHATRAMRSLNSTEGERISNPKNALDSIKVSHRPRGGNEWVEGYGADPKSDNYEESRSNDGDTGTSHPHGTKYKPKMVRFEASGKSRTTGMEYTTTVIEAIGVEHKETTRNYDILAAAFTDVLKNLHDDYGLI